MARLRPRSCTLRTRLCTTPSIGAATGWSRHDRRSSAPAYARRADPSPLRLSRISVIIAAPHAPVLGWARGGDVADTLEVRPRRRAPDHGSGGVIANVLWTLAPPRLDCAEPGSTILEIKANTESRERGPAADRPSQRLGPTAASSRTPPRAYTPRGMTCPVKLADD